MIPVNYFLVIGGLVLLVLILSLFVFPYIVCPTIPPDIQADPRDPLGGFCSVFGY
jgi:hypothetical protein